MSLDISGSSRTRWPIVRIARLPVISTSAWSEMCSSLTSCGRPAGRKCPPTCWTRAGAGWRGVGWCWQISNVAYRARPGDVPGARECGRPARYRKSWLMVTSLPLVKTPQPTSV